MPDQSSEFFRFWKDFFQTLLGKPSRRPMKGNKLMKTITKFIYAAFAVVVVVIGTVTANGALGDLFVSINGGNGAGLIYQYTLDGQSAFASGLSAPRGVAFDHFGNLFVSNNQGTGTTFQATIVKITPGGVQSLFADFPGDVVSEGVAFDSAGNLFVAVLDNSNFPTLPCTIYKITPGGAKSTFGTAPGLTSGIAFGNAGNLFAADNFVQTIYKFAPDGTRSVFVGPSAFPDTGPAGLAFDRFGNLFASTEAASPDGTDMIVKFTPNGVESPFATNLDYPRGLTFDRSGNLFVAQRGLVAPPGAILKFTPDGVETVFASEVPDPQFLAFQLLPTPRPRPSPHPRPTLQF
jgi:sugar lactone lactonase YvrE